MGRFRNSNPQNNLILWNPTLPDTDAATLAAAESATANPFRASPQSIISPLTGQFFLAAAATSLCLLKPSGNTNRMVRKRGILANL